MFEAVGGDTWDVADIIILTFFTKYKLAVPAGTAGHRMAQFHSENYSSWW